jgi:OmpA-OmpF porin, OOP family
LERKKPPRLIDTILPNRHREGRMAAMMQWRNLTGSRPYPVLFLLAAIAGVVPAGTAHSQTIDGFYVSLGGGYNIMGDQTITDVGTPFGRQPGGDVELDGGPVWMGSIGWGAGNGLRFEIESSYRANDLSKASAGALRNAEARGEERKIGVLINAIYDIDLARFDLPWLLPHIGVGFGYVWTEWDGVQAFNQQELVELSGTEGNTAFQGIVGLSAPLPSVPGLAVTADYRYLHLFGDRTYDGRVARSRFGAFPISTKVEDDTNHSFVVGLRYAFGPAWP